MGFEKWLAGAAAAAVTTAAVEGADKAEAGFAPVRSEKVCVVNTAKEFKAQLPNGREVTIPIPKGNDKTSGKFEGGGNWSYINEDGVMKFRLTDPSSGPEIAEVILECDAVS